MKKVFCISFCLVISLFALAQTISQKGTTYRYNGKKLRTPLGNVYIKTATSPNGILSDSVNGMFTLQLRNLQMGSRIGNVTVAKKGMMVFNQQAVDEWSVRKEPLRLILCEINEFEQQHKYFMGIGEREAKKRFDKKVAEIEAKYKAESAELYQKLSEAQEELENVRRHISEYADALARIDLSEMDAQMQEVLDLYYQGEVERSIKKLDEMHLLEKFIQTLDRKQFHEQELDAAIQDSIHILEKMHSSIALLKNSGEWEKAAEYHKIMADKLNTVEEIFGYARFCTEQNKHQEAIIYLKKALDIIKQTDNNNQSGKPLQGAILNNLAISYHYMQQLAEAEEMYNEALAIRRSLVENDPQTYYPDLASTLNNLATLYSITKRLAESEAMYKESLEIRRMLALDNPQKYNPDVACTYNNLALFYNDNNRFDEAEQMYTEALNIYQGLDTIIMRKCYPDIGMTLNNLAGLYQNVQRFADAEALYLRALEIRKQIAKDNPQAFEPDLASTLTNLGLLFVNLKKPEEADSVYREALNIYQHLTTENPMMYEPTLAVVLTNYANYYINTGRFTEAEAMYLNALDVRQRLAKVYPNTFKNDLAITLMNLASLYRTNAIFEKAEQMYLESLVLRRQLVAENPQKYEPGLAIAINNLAGLYRDLMKFEKAETLFLEALTIRRRLASANPQAFNPSVEKTLWGLSYLYILMKEFQKAEEYARETVSMNSSQHSYYGVLAASLLLQGKISEAEMLYSQYKDELKEDFIADMQLFSEIGIVPIERENDVERIKEMLNK